MSRNIASGTVSYSSLSNGGSAWSYFFWIRAADIQPSASSWLNQRIGATAPHVLQYTSTPSIAMQVNWGGYTHLNCTLSNDTWYPVMFDGNQTTQHLYVGETATYTPVTKSQSNSCVLDNVYLNNGGTGNTFLIAEVCIWDRVLTQTEYETLSELDGGTYPNPTTVQPDDIVAYVPFRSDSMSSEFGTESITFDNGTTHTYSALHPNVDPYQSLTLPTYTSSYLKMMG